MSVDGRLLHPSFPRANAYHPEWVIAAASGGANSLWLTEWLTSALDLQPGDRVLDLGCGLAASSLFLQREFGARVWATDLWFPAEGNRQRIEAAGAGEHIVAVHADARDLPFERDFFDAIISIDSFPYYGTDDRYLGNVARFVKPGGPIAIAGAGLMQEWEKTVPLHLQQWWEPGMSCLHSAEWWRRHWERSGLVDVDLSDTMPDGWRVWLDWLRVIAPENDR